MLCGCQHIYIYICGGSAIHGCTFKQNPRIGSVEMLTSFTAARPGLFICFRRSVTKHANPSKEHRIFICGARSGVKTQGKWRKMHKQEPWWVMLLSWAHCIHSKELHMGHEFSCIKYVRRKSKTLRQYRVRERIVYSSMFPGVLSFYAYTNFGREK